MILVLLSLKSAVAVAGGIVTVKSVAFKFPNRFRLMVFDPLLLLLLLVVAVVVPLLVVVGTVLFIFCCRATVTLVGGFMPRVCALSRLTCMTATSTITSERDLSRSPTNFSASAIWSGVPRTTSAPCEGNGWMREISKI